MSAYEFQLSVIRSIGLSWLLGSSACSCCTSVVVVKPAEYGKSDDPPMRGRGMYHARWDPLPEALMRARMVHVAHVPREHSPEVSFTEDQQVVKALAPHTGQKPFTHSVRELIRYDAVSRQPSRHTAL
jgi:hypothetical protein